MPKQLTELPDIIPDKVIKYAQKNVSQGRTEFVDYVCREHSGLVVRTYAFKCQFRHGEPLLNKLRIREIMRRRTGEPGYAVRDLYRTWVGMGNPYRVAWKATRDDPSYTTSWYNSAFGDNWGKWQYEPGTTDRPNLWRVCLNPEVALKKYPYCGYPTDSTWDIIDYMSMWLKEPKIEFFGKARIYPKETLVKKALKDRKFAAYLMKNRNEAKETTIRLISLGYKAGLQLNVVKEAYRKALRYDCAENAVIELIAKNKRFADWIPEHSETARICFARDLLDAYNGVLTDELAKRRSKVRLVCKKLKRPVEEAIEYVESTGVDPEDYGNYLEGAVNMHLDLNKKEVAYPEAFDQTVVKASLETELMSRINRLAETAKKAVQAKIARAAEYIRDQHINAAAYTAYIADVAALELDLTDTKNLFPRDFLRIAEEKKNALQHLREWQKEHFQEAFKAACELYAKYQDMPGTTGCAYCMVLPVDPQDLVNEGAALDHCVGRMGYDSKVVSKKSLITFLRLSDKPDVPYFTCEINLLNWTLAQCYGEHNATPSQEIIDYARGWVEKTKTAVLQAA